MATVQSIERVRISKVRKKSGQPGAVELICDRPLDISATISFQYRPSLKELGALAGTDLGEALIELAQGDTTGPIEIANVQYGKGVRGCISVGAPYDEGVTLADLLDDILRLACQPASQAYLKGSDSVQLEIGRAFNLYLELVEQGGPPIPVATGVAVSPGNGQSLLWTYFDRPLTKHNNIELTVQDMVSGRYLWRVMPWLANLLGHLAQQGVVIGGEIANATSQDDMCLFSVPVSAERPTPADCLEIIVATAETYASYTPSDEDLEKIAREERWRKKESPEVERYGRIRRRWSAVLRKLATQ